MKTLISTIVAAAAFATTTALATLPNTPYPTVNFSGSLNYVTNYANTGTTIKSTVKTASFNTKSLIALLNASSTVTNVLNYETGLNQIPAGSYFIWSITSDDLIVTNKNGFSFDLYGPGSDYYDFAYLEYFDDSLLGTSSINAKTGVGTEQDQTGIYFEFEDYNGNEIECYGTATLNWKYGTASSSGQKATVGVSLKGTGYYAEVNDSDEGIVKSLSGSGSGTATIYSFIYEYGEPFWYYHY